MVETSRLHWVTVVSVLATSLSGALAACRGDTGADDDSGLSDGGDDGTTGSTETCPECIALDEESFDCGCIGGGSVCAISQSEAESLCDAMCVEENISVIPCDGYAPEGSCTSWEPENEIALVTGVRHMDGDWIEGIVRDPAPVWSCDDAYFSPVSGGEFKVNLASSGELLYELGLRNNDVPQSLNGMPLEDYEDVSSAFATLWHDQSETEFSLVVTRSGSNVTLLYELD
jgi:hypothetical protein